ncbi:UNVERIFIED_CONTAM: hypothetical protein PYX00_003696 [Menopon gallinae]|uniref:Uncharacterized protein n=1 Tax=Menopon gallinae TaxID=328185 RepID=A0AAW2I1L6_9NEOP
MTREAVPTLSPVLFFSLDPFLCLDSSGIFAPKAGPDPPGHMERGSDVTRPAKREELRRMEPSPMEMELRLSIIVLSFRKGFLFRMTDPQLFPCTSCLCVSPAETWRSRQSIQKTDGDNFLEINTLLKRNRLTTIGSSFIRYFSRSPCSSTPERLEELSEKPGVSGGTARCVSKSGSSNSGMRCTTKRPRSVSLMNSIVHLYVTRNYKYNKIIIF